MGEEGLCVLALPVYDHVENRKTTRNAKLKRELSMSNARETSNHYTDDLYSGLSDLVGEHNENASNNSSNDLYGCDTKVNNSGDITSESSANSCTENGVCTSEFTREILERPGGLKIRLKIRRNPEEYRSNTSASEARVFLDDGSNLTDLTSLADEQTVDEQMVLEEGEVLPAERVGKTVHLDSTLRVTGSKRKREGSGGGGGGGGGKRNDSLHKVLFMPELGLSDGTYLSYRVKGKTMLEGYKHGNGIFCGHCSDVVSPSQFESHAGMSIRKKPYQHIYDANGITLHDLAIALSQTLDQTNWKKKNDAKPKLKRKPKEPAVIKLKPTAKKSEIDYSSNCVVCLGNDYSVNTFDDRTIIICDQCEKEYHVGCLRDEGRCDLKEIPKDKWFCCQDCDRISVALREFVARGSQVIPSSETSNINKKLLKKQACEVDDNDVQWQLLGGKSCLPEHMPLLSKAVYIFRACFDPITTTNGRDLINLMVHGKSVPGQDFGGMHCVFLTVKSTVVSVGLVRILGHEIAELPMVATRKKCQGKGYFLALFSLIEKLLRSLKVERLVLPAAEHAKDMWINKLGFGEISQENLSKYTKVYQLTQFNETVMLEKKVEQ